MSGKRRRAGKAAFPKVADGRQARDNGEGYFTFFPHVRVVRGKRAVSIHDLFARRVIWLKEPAIATAVSALANGVAVARAVDEAGMEPDELAAHCSVLGQLGVGLITPWASATEAYRPLVTRGLAMERGIYVSGGAVTMELGAQCPYRCAWCSPGNPLVDTACACGVWPRRGEPLTASRRLDAMERLAEQGYTRLILRGGDPLSDAPAAHDLIRHAAKLGMAVELHTTGHYIDAAFCDAVRDVHLTVSVPIPAVGEEAFDRATGLHGSWKRCQMAMAVLDEAGIATKAKIPMPLEGSAEAVAAGKWAAELGCYSFEVTTYGDPLRHTVHDLRQAVGKRSPQQMAVTMAEFYRNVQSQHCFDNACFIAADGTVAPCIASSLRIADLQVTAMEELLHRNLIGKCQATSARRQVPACAGCEFRYGCTSCLVRTEETLGSGARHWDCQYDPATATFAG